MYDDDALVQKRKRETQKSMDGSMKFPMAAAEEEAAEFTTVWDSDSNSNSNSNSSSRKEDESQPQRPSEWLDELLINEYLKSGDGYPEAADVGEEMQMQNEEMLSAEEESWMAQYGQVERSVADADMIEAVDLWDWELIDQGHSRRRARLMGRLVGPSVSLHPSLPSRAGTLKTSAIRQVHLHHVLVASGKVYRLRTPSKRYLSTLPEYDSSNPTRDWGFPILSPHPLSLLSPPSPTCHLSNMGLCPTSQNKEDKGECSRYRYRDRAAERRRLHGTNCVGPCQKGNDSDAGCLSDDDPTIAQEEARLLSFGTQSYAGKIMQSMGWKQGEALGGSRKGILEPLQPTGNIGTSGLGWKHN